jgi:putative two-component system response regulator
MKERPSILIVDDQPENILILDDLLADDYEVVTASNGEDALALLHNGMATDLILMDVMMPVMDGFEACRRIKASSRLKHIPLLFLSSLESAADEACGLSLGAEDFIHKPFSAPVVMARVRNHLQLADARRQLQVRNDDLEQLVEQRTRQVVEQSEELVRRTRQVVAAQDATITAFCSLAEVRDNETGNHIRRTQNYVRALAERLQDHPRFAAELDEESIVQMYKSAPLHDVGKVAIPDDILLKPGKLTPEEWAIMQRHCEYGRDAILQAELGLEDDAGSFLKYAREIAYGHHERWDGTGYPGGLAGEAIPLSARLMAVADVYDALISKRVYKPAFPHEKAVEIIADSKGSHFDPDIADTMLEIEAEFKSIAYDFQDEE